MEKSALKNLAEKENAVGFLLPAMEKRELFPYVTESGTLPRKTFSMGHDGEKILFGSKTDSLI